MLRNGRLDTANSLLSEANIDMNMETRNILVESYQINLDLANQSLKSLSTWIENNKSALIQSNSSLPFSEAKLRFLLTLENASLSEGISFIQREFAFYLEDSRYIEEITKLTSQLMFKAANPSFRAAELPVLWTKVTFLFQEDFCRINEVPFESPLYSVIKAGIIAIPTIKMNEGLLLDAKTEENKPYSIDLPSDLNFHSTFVCPVIKEVVTSENPPVLLKCGHVISRLAVYKMKANAYNQVKCPTCPNNTKIVEIQELCIF